MKFTNYFLDIRKRADRVAIRDEWIERAINFPIKEVVQADGRIRRWTQVPEMESRYLRVVLCRTARPSTMPSSIGAFDREDQILRRH